MRIVVLVCVAITVAGSTCVRADDEPAVRAALAAIEAAEPIVKRDKGRPDMPVVAIHFRPNFGKVTDDDLVHLQTFTKLRSVELPNKRLVTDAGLAHLADLAELEEVNLNGTGVTAAAVVRFVKGRTRLMGLELTGVPLADGDMSELAKLTELRTLNLRGTLITDKGVARLTPLRKLRWLNISTIKGRITDAGLVHLAAFAELEDLDLDRTEITDAGLAQLAALLRLRNLQMAFTAVTDAGLVHLESLSKLEGLNLRGTQVTKAGVEKLRKRIPTVKVGYGPATK